MCVCVCVLKDRRTIEREKNKMLKRNLFVNEFISSRKNEIFPFFLIIHALKKKRNASLFCNWKIKKKIYYTTSFFVVFVVYLTFLSF